jgi:soluble lytic murein transglycosylase-like protein
MARFTLGLLFAIKLLSPGAAGAQGLADAGRGGDPGTGAEPAAEVAVVAARPELDVPGMITDAAGRWGLDPNQMLRVAWCESKFDPGAYNRSSGASGVFQFIPRTWAWASAAVGQAQASPFDAAANVEAAAWLMKTQGPRHWACR